MIWITAVCEAQEAFAKKAVNLINILKQYHYRELIINHETLTDIKLSFLHSLDSSGLYFLQEDIDKLSAIDLHPADADKGKFSAFLNPAVKCYTERLRQAKAVINDILGQPLDYQIKEKIILSMEGGPFYCKDREELLVSWQSWLKYRILLNLFYKHKLHEFSMSNQELLEREEAKIRGIVKKQELKRIQDILTYSGGVIEFARARFLYAFVQRYDPHSEYLSYNERIDFKSSLSAEAYSFGFYLIKNKNDEIQIGQIVPGGPAWKSAKLNIGDIVIQIKTSEQTLSAEELLVLTGEQANRFIDSVKSDKIELTVRKKNGLNKSVTLIKEKLQVEENTITGFILNGAKRIGYIYLPAFYSEWDESNGFGCANDLAKEIIKLKRENIQGLILDLRNNSGGSLIEAQSLAGIFIDEGPLFIQGNRDARPVLIKDSNRGIIYDGPLILMLNEYSASTSEFVASALKDYNRALLVGSTTYGKATSQITLPVVKDVLNFDAKNHRAYSSLDFIQITTNQYYNLSGGTHQLRGIAPDIPLPGYLEDIAYSEKNLPHALLPDKIEKKVTYQKAKELPIALLAKKSAYRVARDKDFQKIKDLDRRLKKYFVKTIELPLDLDGFIKHMKDKYVLLESVDQSVRRISTIYKVENSQYNLEIIQMSPYQQEMNDEYIKYIQADIYIQESYRIMGDLIQTMK